jgi:hypothetical protein
MRLHFLGAILLLAACKEPPPPAPPVVLDPGPDTIHVAIGQDAEGAWVGSQYYAVLSPGNDQVVLVDFGSGRWHPLQAGDRIQHPIRLFALADTFFVSDWGRQRVTAWTADGQFVREAPLLAGGALPSAIDEKGRFYAALAPNPGRDGSGNRDSAAVVRGVPGTAALDTVARLTPLDLAKVVTDQGTRFDRRVFSGEDHWGVLPDGAVWVARHYHNRVDWRDTSGKWTRGGPLFDRILQVTETDRERFIAQFPPDLRRSASALQFAPLKPPFVRAFSTADGHVFLEKSRHVADTMQAYQEVGRDGRFIRTLEVHGWSRLLAGSPAQLLVSTPDSAGGFTMGVVGRADKTGGTGR